MTRKSAGRWASTSTATTSSRSRSASLLAALAGAFMAPTVSVVPGLGVEIIVLSFAVVVIGGLGSLPGAALGALIVGLVRSVSVHYMPQVELFVIYFVMAMVLVLPAARPFQPGRAAEDMSRDRTPLAHRRDPRSRCSRPGRSSPQWALFIMTLALRQGPCRARAAAAAARRARVVRSGALLLPRRLRGRRARPLLRRR